MGVSRGGLGDCGLMEIYMGYIEWDVGYIRICIIICGINYSF